ncbi:PaaI family thioesterase [Clostridium sp.]
MTLQDHVNKLGKSEKNQSSESQQAFWQTQIKTVNETNPFMRHNGIYATYLDADRAEIRAQAGDTGRNAMGSVHGGLMFIMGEMAAGLLARGDGRKYVTLDTSFRYLRSSMGEKELVAEASFIKRGKSIVNCRSIIHEDGSEKTLAEGEFSFYCLDK